jgi:hypothetical protein
MKLIEFFGLSCFPDRLNVDEAPHVIEINMIVPVPGGLSGVRRAPNIMVAESVRSQRGKCTVVAR